MTELPEPENSSILHADDHTPAPELRVTIFNRYLLQLAERFARDTRGVIIILFAVVLPVMLLSVGAAIDFGQLYTKRSLLQAAADASALTAAHGLQLANSVNSDVEAVAEASAMANLKEMPGTVGFSVEVSQNPPSVTVTLTQTPGLYFMDQLTGNKDTVISARATARVSGGTPVCVIGLDPSASGTVSLDSNSRLTAAKCAVYSNSKSSSGLSSKSNAVLTAELICSAGGVVGGASNLKPDYLTDCPPIKDPLASRPAPPIGSCTAKNLEIIDVTTTLRPGVYCGGLQIDGNARVRFEPGVYVIKDGAFNVDSNSKITGQLVGFYLIGKDSTFRFASNASVTLSAPTYGPMAGLLFYEAHGSPDLRRHEILSNYARDMVGTIYLPHGRLIVDADNDVADQSAYTVIIARRIELYSGPNLVLNTDYEATNVPVPDGIIAQGRIITLTE